MIVDQYHARQHLRKLARRLQPHDEASQHAWMTSTNAACSILADSVSNNPALIMSRTLRSSEDPRLRSGGMIGLI